MSIPLATPSQVVKARPQGTEPTDTRPLVEEGEVIYKRGLVLSVMQTVFFVIALALLFGVVAPGIFVTLASIVTCLVILGSLHYWVWGRWTPRA